MSIDLSNYRNTGTGGLGLSQQGAQQSNTREQQAPAQYWMNIGYFKKYTDEQGHEAETFVSRHGVPLDYIKDHDLSSIRNVNMATMRQDQNDLHHAVMEQARSLEPGEALLIAYDEDANFGVELRRAAAAAEPIRQDSNAPKQFSFRGRVTAGAQQEPEAE